MSTKVVPNVCQVYRNGVYINTYQMYSCFLIAAAVAWRRVAKKCRSAWKWCTSTSRPTTARRTQASVRWEPTVATAIARRPAWTDATYCAAVAATIRTRSNALGSVAASSNGAATCSAMCVTSALKNIRVNSHVAWIGEHTLHR